MAPDTISRASIKTGPNAELVQFNDVRLGCIGIWGAKIEEESDECLSP